MLIKITESSILLESELLDLTNDLKKRTGANTNSKAFLIAASNFIPLENDLKTANKKIDHLQFELSEIKDALISKSESECILRDFIKS